MQSSVLVDSQKPDRSLDEAEVLSTFRAAPVRLLDGGHARLAYRRFGQGPDVVFVHGWPLHGATFRRVIPFLADEFTCHVVDLPGAGRSEWKDETPLDLVSHSKALRAALAELGLERYALFAQDSGGFIARLIAENNPRVTGLVLGNTELPGHTPWLIALYAATVRVPGGRSLLRTLMKSSAVRHSFLGFGGCFVKRSYADGDFHELFVRPLLESNRASQAQFEVLRSLHLATLERLTEIHRHIDAPVRLVWGTEDPFFPLQKARAMLDEFGGPSDLVEIAGGKLFIHEDRPREFADYAKPFLRDCFDAAGS